MAKPPECGRCDETDFVPCVPRMGSDTEGTCYFYTPDLGRPDAN
jgi:hypothetical protein